MNAIEPTTQTPNEETIAVKKTRHHLEFRKYTQQIWLAGLGAFSRAEEEGGKLFDSLVKIGEDLEVKTTTFAEKTVDAVEEIKENVTERLTQRATHTLSKVEQVFADVVTQATHRLGLQSTKQNSDLSEQLRLLTEKIDSLAEEVKTLKEKR